MFFGSEQHYCSLTIHNASTRIAQTKQLHNCYIPCNITATIGPMDKNIFSLIRETTVNPMVNNTSIIEMIDSDLTALSHGMSRKISYINSCFIRSRICCAQLLLI